MKTIQHAALLLACVTMSSLPAALLHADSQSTQPASAPIPQSKFASKMAFINNTMQGAATPAAPAPTIAPPPEPTPASAPPAPNGTKRTFAPIVAALEPASTPTPESTVNRNVPPPGYVDSTQLHENATIRQRMYSPVDEVNLDNVSARQAFKWWSTATGVPIVVNWDSLATQNVDPEARIHLTLHRVQAGKLLGLIMQQTTLETAMLFEQNKEYVEIMTKADANKRPVVELYEVGDLIDEPVDASTHAPKFDFAAAITSANSGSGGNSSASAITGGTSSFSSGTEKTRKTASQKADELCKLIRDTIEPEVWDQAGGTSTIHFFNGSLIIKAPMYVQAQIGYPATHQTEERPLIFIVNAGKQ